MIRKGTILAIAITTTLFTTVIACGNKSADGRRPKVDSLPYSNSVKETKGNIEDSLIVPGSEVGKVKIGMTTEALIKAIGEPDLSDAAMGKAWLTWYNNKNRSSQLDVYTAYKDSNMGEKTVQLIRVSSQDLNTEDFIRVGASPGDIEKKFPELKYISHYRKDGTGEIVSLWADQKAGVAFEFSAVEKFKKCSAVIVFDVKRPLLSIYQSFLNIHHWTELNEAE
jgi:hypothetical protein